MQCPPDRKKIAYRLCASNTPIDHQRIDEVEGNKDRRPILMIGSVNPIMIDQQRYRDARYSMVVTLIDSPLPKGAFQIIDGHDGVWFGSKLEKALPGVQRGGDGGETSLPNS